MIVPMAPPEIVAGVPGMNWIAPSGLAPGVGMVPGTLDVVGAASDVVTVADNVVAVVGDVMPDAASALRVDVVLTCCASVELQPNKTMAAVMRTKLRIINPSPNCEAAKSTKLLLPHLRRRFRWRAVRRRGPVTHLH